MKTNKLLAVLLICAIAITALTACKSTPVNENDNTKDAGKFISFEANDIQNGETVSEKVFTKNKVTVVNFWFNTCPPCIEEMPSLKQLNNELKEKGGQVLGINVEAGYGEERMNIAKSVLQETGAEYQNLYFGIGSPLETFSGELAGYPTTFVVDAKGNIVGNPILGSIDTGRNKTLFQEKLDKALKN